MYTGEVILPALAAQDEAHVGVRGRTFITSVPGAFKHRGPDEGLHRALALWC